jgi:lysophospholipase L1-like esterase
VFVNLGSPGATVADALDREVADAIALSPTLVTVWVNTNDIIAGVSPTTYHSQLDDLVRRLRRNGATRVLLANAPPLDHLPSYLACRPNPPPSAGPCRLISGAGAMLPDPVVLDQQVDSYNVATAAVAIQEGATLVDLHALSVRAQADGTAASLVSADGLNPSSAGHRAVAAAFAAALRSAPAVSSGPAGAAGG